MTLKLRVVAFPTIHKVKKINYSLKRDTKNWVRKDPEWPEEKVRFEEFIRKKREQKTFANLRELTTKEVKRSKCDGTRRPNHLKKKIGPKPSPIVSQLNRHLEETNPMILLSIIMNGKRILPWARNKIDGKKYANYSKQNT